MKTDVAEFIARCEKCVSRKNPVPSARAPLQTHRTGYPFEKVAMDILEVPLTGRGNRYMLVVSDYFSKWVDAFALKSHTAPVVAEILVDQIISRFGAPNQIHSDQGPEFESKLISEMCRILNIDKIRTTGYHSQSDGQVERFNRTLLAMLSKYVQDNQKDWDVHLQKVMMGFRTSEHESTKYTTAFVLFGRELRLPLDVQYHLPDNSHADACSDFVKKMKNGFADAYKVVRDNLVQAQKTMKYYYDRKTQGVAFWEGDQVWYFDPKVKTGRSTKSNRSWKGPFTLKNRISDLVYRMQLNG
jgi:transposase InsO family protein